MFRAAILLLSLVFGVCQGQIVISGTHPLHSGAQLVLTTAGSGSPPADIRQSAVCDPAPGNQYPIANNTWVCAFPMATLSGSALIVFPTQTSYGGQTITGVSDTVNGAYAQIDYLQELNPGYTQMASYAKVNAAVLGVGSVGTATSGTITTLTDSTKAWTTNEFSGLTLDDLTQNITVTVASNTATVLTFTGTLTPATNDIYGVGGYVTISSTGFDDYNGDILVEVEHVATSPIVSHNALNQTGITNGSNNINAGSIVGGSNNGLMLLASISINAFGGTTVPAVGTSPVAFSLNGNYWSFDYTKPTAMLEYAHLSSPGTLTPTASAQETSSNDYLTFALFLEDHP